MTTTASIFEDSLKSVVGDRYHINIISEAFREKISVSFFHQKVIFSEGQAKLKEWNDPTGRRDIMDDYATACIKMAAHRAGLILH